MTGADAHPTARAHRAYVGAFIDELVRAGVRDVCFAPGSRSTPLIMTAARHPQLSLWLHIDERSAAFFALGMAKTSGRPVALVCTSGTAAANFFPAVVEAYYDRVPLIVLTADRPHEARDRGAPQTMDQVGLYGSHVKWHVDMAPSSDDPARVRYSRTVACRAVATAMAPPAGPVHLNFPLQEPLIPAFEAGPDESDACGAAAPQGGPENGAEGGAVAGGEPRPFTVVAAGRALAPQDTVAALAQELRHIPRGLIVCGPQRDSALPEAASRLAHALGWPILADPLSLVRCGPHDRRFVISTYDALLRDRHFAAAHGPEAVLRLGAPPTSKPLQLFLAHCHDARHIVVDEPGHWREPLDVATDVIWADAAAFSHALADALSAAHALSSTEKAPGAKASAARTSSARTSPQDASSAEEDLPPWAASWRRADKTARESMEAAIAALEPGTMFEGRVFTELAALLPPDAALFVGNSMPVRDLDTFFPSLPHPIRFMANRGVNGIDGVVSTALGAAAGLKSQGGKKRPLVLVIGDLSFFHDQNGLLAAKLHELDATIILVHNDGGGIFSFLPQSQPQYAPYFEPLFGTPTGLDFRPLVGMYGGRHIAADTWDRFREGVAEGLNSRGLTVVEVRTDRRQNAALHARVIGAAAEALRRGEG